MRPKKLTNRFPQNVVRNKQGRFCKMTASELHELQSIDENDILSNTDDINKTVEVALGERVDN
jgi:hypothetical protein